MVVILLLVPSSTSSSSLTTITTTTTACTSSVSVAQPKYHIASSSQRPYYCYGSRPPLAHQSRLNVTPANAKNRNYSREYVNHITRINISNDYPQITASHNDEPEATVKEGEFLKFVLTLNKFDDF
jgi:hypothetical protein